MITKSHITAFIVALVLASCAPLPTEASTPLPVSTSTDLPFRTTPTGTPFPTQTSQPLLSSIPTPNKKPVLLAYTLWVDGGDELENCLAGSNQPIFVLYPDGELIFLRDNQYWQAVLSQDELDSLTEELAKTGLPQAPEVEEGVMGPFRTLNFNGTRFLPPRESYSTSPFKKAEDLINQYQPKVKKPYMPDNVTLWIFSVRQLAPFEESLPKPIPPVRNWNTELPPLSQYHDGYESISGDIVPKIMAQFDHFPDYQIFGEGTFLYITAICANIPSP